MEASGKQRGASAGQRYCSSTAATVEKGKYNIPRNDEFILWHQCDAVAYLQRKYIFSWKLGSGSRCNMLNVSRSRACGDSPNNGLWLIQSARVSCGSDFVPVRTGPIGYACRETANLGIVGRKWKCWERPMTFITGLLFMFATTTRPVIRQMARKNINYLSPVRFVNNK